MSITPYIADIAHRKAKLVIELDGSQHVELAEKDEQRTRYLEDRGWMVMRFWNGEVMENAEGVAERILLVAAERMGGEAIQAVPPRQRKPKASE